ncbi:C6 zinc finger domain protein [Thelonectria olida]|uniref:C6 zinc finger domain protein n=1 Tax=Thelonectria olida TaxID=1576542 RepID=A0A9P8WFU0_9HYPO|nr:C6 zinc finger domain protein [Thelonectria olida]
MGTTPIHPSQRRFSCEACRRHKSRCRRLHPNDAKCARCMLLGAECTDGQQKRVGRPRRPAARDVQPASSNNDSNSSGSLKQGQSQLDWASINSTATTQAPLLDACLTAPNWSSIGMDFLDQTSLASDTASYLDQPFHFSDAILPTADSLHAPINSFTVQIPAASQPEYGIDTTDAVAKLSKINLDLHIRVACVEKNKVILDFNSVILKDSPLHIDGFTLTEFMINTSQDFLLILTRLLENQHSHRLLPSLPLPPSSQKDLPQISAPACATSRTATTQQPLLAPLALAITSIFTQLTALYEMMLELLTTRIERIAIDPIPLIPGLTFGGLDLTEPCEQGILFAEVVAYLVESMEQALGINSGVNVVEAGLLSKRQVEVLWGELDGRDSLIPGHAIMKPAHIKRLLGTVASIFRQLSKSL